MISLIGDTKNKQCKLFIKVSDNDNFDSNVSLALLKSNAVIVDTVNYGLMSHDLIRMLVESNHTYFTVESFNKLKTEIKNMYLSTNKVNVIGECVDPDYNITTYKMSDVLAIKEEKVSLFEEIRYGLNEVFTRVPMIMKLSYTNFLLETKNTTLGSYWHIVRDIIFFITYISFMIFMRGNGDIDGIPVILFLVSGLVPWYYISDVMNGSVNCIRNSNGIISKVKFPVTIIPFYSAIGAFYKRALTYIILAVIVIYFFATNQLDTFKPLTFLYFNAAMLIYMVSFALVFSSLISVSKDFTELYRAIQRVQMYFLPVFWDFTMIGKKLSFSTPLYDTIGHGILVLLKLNPVAYILNGFRASFGGVNHTSPAYTLCFWIIVIVMYTIGFSLQYRLRKIYADVL
ncbi:hypothetical protein RZE82_05800 [Mollicutes bacterium LVI A0039]|nr:hypothetical protein RZE82_05800 [Mollicutes bacterium LVI A0039]